MRDLRDVRRGILRREARFGYVEVSTRGYVSPCFRDATDPSVRSPPPPLVQRERGGGAPRVTFDVPIPFGLATGAPRGWQRRDDD